MVFIFLLKHGETFSLHIDTVGTNTMAASKVTEYEKMATQPEPPPEQPLLSAPMGASPEDDNGKPGDLIDIWTWTTTFTPPNGDTHKASLEDLDWNYWYEIVEMPNMRYQALPNVGMAQKDSDLEPLDTLDDYYDKTKDEKDETTGYSVLFFMEYSREIYYEANNGELVVNVTFSNERVSEDYLTDSHIVTNEIEIVIPPTPTPTPTPTPPE